ncbi:expansin-like EG45 domain-containing protein [Haematococcus lacustris]|uniref:Expansin-like EG45 domain-containing protein n=1 Tax=Haematococcus lacustris TaxID=44745 RepID=A0A6A0A2Q8_HAELA|nr:expansin-like EG45 domain-containing protein [Haematococcus lacustris]
MESKQGNIQAGCAAGTASGTRRIDKRVPGLKLFIMQEELKQYCRNELVLGNTTLPTGTQGEWYSFVIPLADFGCGGGTGYPELADIDRVDFQNMAIRNAVVCITELALG